MQKITLIHDDCIKATKNIKEPIFDAIITDPPYNISKKNNFSTMKGKRKGIDFGQWDKNFNPCSWLETYTPLVKKNGCVIIFCSFIYVSFIIAELENLCFETKDILKWKKSNPMPRNINRRYVLDTEFAIWAVKKGAKWTFNKPKNKSYLRALFETSVVNGNERTIHPAQKSLKLMKQIVDIHTNKDDLICDPFMGSGTTGVASLSLKRNFFGVEIEKDYFDISKKRIAAIS